MERETTRERGVAKSRTSFDVLTATAITAALFALIALGDEGPILATVLMIAAAIRTASGDERLDRQSDGKTV